jgi:hypothetical protein
MNQGDPLLRGWYGGFYLVPHGLLEEAFQNEKRRLDLDPLSPVANNSLAWAHFLLKQHEAALQQAQTALELSPFMIEPYWTLGLSYLALGRHEEAIKNLEKARSLAPDNTFTLSLLIRGYVAVDRQADASQLSTHLQELSRRRYVSPTHLAGLYNQTDNCTSSGRTELVRCEKSCCFIECRNTTESARTWGAETGPADRLEGLNVPRGAVEQALREAGINPRRSAVRTVASHPKFNGFQAHLIREGTSFSFGRAGGYEWSSGATASREASRASWTAFPRILASSGFSKSSRKPVCRMPWSVTIPSPAVIRMIGRSGRN